MAQQHPYQCKPTHQTRLKEPKLNSINNKNQLKEEENSKTKMICFLSYQIHQENSTKQTTKTSKTKINMFPYMVHQDKASK